MKKVVVITASLRNNSNSDELAKYFVKGALESGNEVEVISLKNKKLGFCIGCMTCQKTGACFQKDDATEIEKSVLTADVVVFATPVYYYSMAGQLKTLIDRLNPLYSKDYRFKEVYLLTTAAENEDYTPEYTKNGIQGWVDCFEGVTFQKTIFCGGVDKVGEIQGNSALFSAYETGKNI